MSTEPFAPHIDGLAYSRESDTVEAPPAPKREWWAAIAVAVAVVGAAAIIADAIVTLNKSNDIVATQPSTISAVQPPVLSTTLLTPPPVTIAPSASVSAPPAQHVDNPDEVFAASWNAQMQAYPFPDEYCVANHAHPGCWLQLQSTDPSDSEFQFLGRGRCDYIRSEGGPPGAAITDAAQQIRTHYRDITQAQSYELVALAIHAYCPQYSQYE